MALTLVAVAAQAQRAPAGDTPGMQAAPDAPPVLSVTRERGSATLDGHTLYRIDPTGAQTVETLDAAGASLDWQLRAPGQQHRVDGAALWLRFDAQTPPGERWFLAIGSTRLDRVELFYRRASGAWASQEAGDNRSVSSWPLPGREPTFELATSQSTPVRYYLRIEHERVDFGAPLSVYSQSALLVTREREQFLLGAYFGLALLITLISLANAVLYRDRNFGAYAVYVFALSAGQAAYLGVGAQHLWDQWLKWNELATLVLPGISVAAALWFVQVVTEPARFSRALELACWSTIAAVLSAVALDAVVGTRASFMLVMVFTGVGLLMVLGLIALVWSQGNDPQIRLIALGFLPVVVMALFPLARGLNLIPNSALTRYGVSIGAALAMPILFYALSLRSSRRREPRLRAAELPHSDALTGLADRQVLAHKLDGAIARARSQKHQCALLAIKLTNYQAIMSEHGPDAAERALVVTAAILRQSMTDIDLAARTGDHEFALLVDGPTTAAAANSRAQQVVARGLQDSAALPPLITLKFHVVVALLPDAEMDAAHTLRFMRESLQAMQADPRRAIRALNF